MGQLKTAINVLAAAEILCAAMLVVTPNYIFPPCDAPMHCHYSYLAVAGLAGLIAWTALLKIVSRGVEAARMLSGVTAACGALVILYPSKVIGVCASPKMPCNYGLLPVWNLLGAGVICLSAIVFFMAKERP